MGLLVLYRRRTSKHDHGDFGIVRVDGGDDPFTHSSGQPIADGELDRRIS